MPDRHGPYRSNRFLVEIDGVETASFSRIQLPAATNAVVEYRAGTDRTDTSRQLRGSSEYETLVLERGVTESTAVYEWFKLAEDGKVDEARRAVAVVLLDEAGDHAVRWEFKDAWPVRYQPPTLDANENGVAVERFEIAHEGMERQ